MAPAAGRVEQDEQFRGIHIGAAAWPSSRQTIVAVAVHQPTNGGLSLCCCQMEELKGMLDQRLVRRSPTIRRRTRACAHACFDVSTLLCTVQRPNAKRSIKACIALPHNQASIAHSAADASWSINACVALLQGQASIGCQQVHSYKRCTARI